MTHDVNVSDTDLYCIYCHRNTINGKRYFGQTVFQDNPELRWGKNGEGYQYNDHFWKAIQKYGWDNFEHYILQTDLTKEEADELEDLNIIAFNTTDHRYGYNHRGGGSTGKLSSDTKTKISAKLKTLYANGYVHPMLGKHHSDEAKDKLRKVHIGKSLSEEHKQKISSAEKGRIHTKEALRKQSLTKTGRIKINNGCVDKYILPNELDYYISLGYNKGSLHHTNKDRIWINDGETSKFILKDQLNNYLKLGYHTGRLK